MDLSGSFLADALPAAVTQGEDVLYFPIKVAVARLGGVKATALALGESVAAVKSWISPLHRTRPSEPSLHQLSVLSGVSLYSFHRYFARLETYKEREKFRRRN